MDESTCPVRSGDTIAEKYRVEREPVSVSITVSAGEQRVVQLRFNAGQATTVEPKSDDDSPGFTLRLAGYITGGFGLLGLGIGTGFGVHAITTQNDALTHCRDEDPKRCTPEALELNDSAQTAATVSTVGVVLGSVALATGIVLLLVAPSDGDAAEDETARGWGTPQLVPLLGPGAMGVSLTQHF